MTEQIAVWSALSAAANARRPVVLATIVRAKGSTPRGVGSKMLFAPDGQLVGTVGGGCGEAEVIDAACESLRDGRVRHVRIDLTRDMMSMSPAVCGGVFDVLVEPCLPPSDTDLSAPTAQSG